MSTPRNLLSVSAGVSISLHPVMMLLTGLVAILRPKNETKFSIQDRHPTRESIHSQFLSRTRLILSIVLFIDLVSKYSEILPPTIAKKKRESERKVPVRKHTRPTDMRMSRSRISAGADLKELHAQQLAQRGLKPGPRSPPLVPPVPPVPTIVHQAPTMDVPPSSEHHDEGAHGALVGEEPSEITASPAHTDIDLKDDRTPVASQFANIPPPPPLAKSPDYSAIPPPPPIAQRTPEPPHVEAPRAIRPQEQHPVFKEPPPEDEDLPPRPSFKEPPPERDDSPPPRPNFAEPPPEPASPPAVSPSAVSPSATSPSALSPAATSPIPGFSSHPVSPRSRSGSRDVSPAQGSLSRRSSVTPSTHGTGAGVRGPRVSATRGPRTGGGSVSSMVSNFNNRASVTGSSLARPASPATSNGRSPSRPMSGNVKRSSMSRVSQFERRTMASDAEEDVVQ